MVDTMTKKQRSYCMSRIKSKNTKPELLLRKKLFKKGFRYRVNYNKLPGSPDIVFTKKRIAIFVDGDFWHGRYFSERKNSYNEYWLKKIKRNIERDKNVTEKLLNSDWKVLRIWGKDLIKTPDNYVEKIERMIICYNQQ